jgi:hypothetical protein
MYVNIVRHSPNKGFLERNLARRIVPCSNGFRARNGDVGFYLDMTIKKRIWQDSEAIIDFLNFGHTVDLVADLATNHDISPSTIGVYGDWGSGKSILMHRRSMVMFKCLGLIVRTESLL